MLRVRLGPTITVSVCWLIVCGLSLFSVCASDEPVQVDFARDIQPIFAQHCYQCHGPRKQESNYRLDVRDIALRGGDLGEPPIVPNKSGESFLLKAVADPKADVVMPPKGARLSEAEIALLRTWIDQGAVWPDELAGQATLKTDHWSFQAVTRPELPAEKNDPWVAHAIDAFILARLREGGLTPSPAADRVTLIRRVYLDVWGLPPSPDEVFEFVQDGHPLAYERMIDRVLASPRYGERWARHWLDIVRFAESQGFETNRERPNAWPYRDYVIDALNGDKPYDQFVKEQIAGDALGAEAATGFLVAGANDIVKSQDVNLQLMQRQDELADIVSTTGATFLGLTIGCARCHNHKFDPILQQDYYAMQAVFAGVVHAERDYSPERSAADIKRLVQARSRLEMLTKDVAKYLPVLNLAPAVNAQQNVETFDGVEAKFVRFTITATSGGSEPCIDELEIFSADGANAALASSGAVASSSGNLPGYEIHQLKHIHDGGYGNSKSWISNQPGAGWVQIEMPKPAVINRIVWGRDRQSHFSDRVATKYRIEVATQADHWTMVASSDRRLPPDENVVSTVKKNLNLLPADQAARAQAELAEIRQLEQFVNKLDGSVVKAYLGQFQQPAATHRLHRGDPMQIREIVAPNVLTVSGVNLDLPDNAPEQQRRTELANWIASDRNPLTARVMVNRLWQHHFGAGLVSTSSDFGANGAPPSHPKLLDWLAAEFIGQDESTVDRPTSIIEFPNPKSAIRNPKSPWSLKSMHRLMLTSSTYRQASFPRDDCLAKDAASRWLWRFPPRRLEAEAIRDSILSVSGVLDLRMGGPGFDVFDVQMENVRHYFPKEKFGPAEWRRMIYVIKYRQQQDGTFGAFDCPDASQVMPDRPVSTSPLQAFNLLNSNFILQQAELLSERIEHMAPNDRRKRVECVFEIVFGRSPDESEMEGAARLAEIHGFTTLCRALLNSNEFLFVP